MKIVFLARSTFYMKNELPLVTIRSNLRQLPIKQQQSEIYKMQYAMEFEPTNMRQKRISLLRLLCRQMKLKPLRLQYIFPIHYHHHLNMSKLHRCVRMVINQMEVPHVIKSYYIEWLTRVVKKKPMFSKQPKYLNSKQLIKTFNEVPWDHCSECNMPNQLWANTPRQTVPQTDPI